MPVSWGARLLMDPSPFLEKGFPRPSPWCSERHLHHCLCGFPLWRKPSLCMRNVCNCLGITVQDKCFLEGKIWSAVVQEWVGEKIPLVKDLMWKWLSNMHGHCSVVFTINAPFLIVCKDFLLSKSCMGLGSLDQRLEKSRWYQSLTGNTDGSPSRSGLWRLCFH